MFFIVGTGGILRSVLSALCLTAAIIFGVFMTFAASRLLSKTILKGIPSSFILELPPYRRPKIGSVIIRSVFDRTLFVLGRAVVVAAPAGLVIWVFANIQMGELSLLGHVANFLDPFAQAIGLDGYILFAFILGFPANEIVLPIIIMAYLSEGSLMEMGDIAVLRQILLDNGWTWVTALCVMVFSLFHWPCSTTCLTIKRETKSWRWTAAALLVPTATGLLLCFFIANFFRLLGLG